MLDILGATIPSQSLRAIAMKAYSTFPKAPTLIEPDNQIV